MEDEELVTRRTSSDPSSDDLQKFQQMLAERSAASGIKPIDHSNETISMPTEDRSVIEQIGTLLSNPFSGSRALVNQTRGGIRNSLGMSDQGDRDGVYGSLTNLARAKESNDLETQQALASGAVLTGQTVADLLQGDPTAMALKTAKKYKPIYNTAKKAYMGLKGGKVAKNTL